MTDLIFTSAPTEEASTRKMRIDTEHGGAYVRERNEVDDPWGDEFPVGNIYGYESAESYAHLDGFDFRQGVEGD